MTIRSARPQDAGAAARLLYDALHDVAHRLTGKTAKRKRLNSWSNIFGRTRAGSVTVSLP